MNKVFISTISLQAKSKDLEIGKYEPYNFKLEKNIETRFPIMPIILNEASSEDNIKLVVVRSNNESTKRNFELFMKELSALLERLGIGNERVITEEILLEEDQSKRNGIKLFNAIADSVPDDSEVYLDITYGTKPMSLLSMLSSYCLDRSFAKNVEIVRMVYGELVRDGDGKAIGRRLYDETYLLDLIELRGQLMEIGINDPSDAINNMEMEDE